MATRSIFNSSFLTKDIDLSLYDDRKMKKIREEIREFSKCEVTFSETHEPDRYRVQKVFEILAVYEELMDSSDGRMYDDLRMWLKDIFDSSDDVRFKRLLKDAWLQKYSFKSSYPPPHPDRPSFILLNTKWMKNRGYNFVAQPLLYSIYTEIESCSDDIIEF